MTTRPGYVWDATASEWVEIGQAAVVSPFKYQTSQPSSPATGDIWIDSDEDVPSVDSTLYYRWTKTMSGGETSLSGTDNNSLALKYTPGYESVFINGVLQVRGSDYVATTGTTVTGLIALTANDVVMVESIVAYSVGDTYTQSQMTSLLDGKSPISTTGLILLNTTTVGSAVSSVTVSNVFSSTYENYRIVVSSIDASATTNIRIQFGSANSAYYGSQLYDLYTGGATATDRTNNASSLMIGVTGTVDNTFTSLDVYSPNLAKITGVSGTYYGGGYSGWYGGEQSSSTQFTSFNILMGTGTMTGGTIEVYGYK
jgi:hypothetical protein